MPRFPKRKTSKGSFSEDVMREAVNLVTEGRSIRSVAKEKKLAPATLARYIQKQKKNPGQVIRMIPNYSVNKIFSNEQEDSLADYVLTCSKMFYGLSTVEVRKIAYEMAIINKIKCPDKWKEKEIAGVEWMAGFMHRHKNLSLRLAEGCSLSRATSFNEHNVAVFFTNLEKILKKHPSLADGSRIFNLDETATKTVPGESRVIAERGSKQVCRVTSAEKGTLVTTCAFVSAIGNTIPPVMIFPRVHFKDHMLNGAPSGTLGLAQPTGWMTSDLFFEVMKHFIRHTSSSSENPCLLIFDNHESHISYRAIKLAKDSGVEILTLPPHSSNKMQPLDVGVFGPFQTYYRAAHDSWMTRNPGKTFSIYNVAECVGIAHAKGMTPENIQSAFRKTGLYPFDRHVFTEVDFLPSKVTDRPDPTVASSSTSEMSLSSTSAPSQSGFVEQKTRADGFVSPKEFKGYPKAEERKSNRRPRKKGRSFIPTDTPELELIKESKTPKPLNKAVKKIKRVVFEEDRHSSESDVETLNEDAAMDLTEQIRKEPEKGDYVLVKFDKSIFYVGQVLTEKDENNDMEVFFLRKAVKLRGFVTPKEVDIGIVSVNSIEMVLPKPKPIGVTKRQQSSVSFEINLDQYNIR